MIYGRRTRSSAPKGSSFKSEPVEIDYGENAWSWGIYLEDPDGITMELFQPARGES